MKSFVHFVRLAPVILALTVFVLPLTADQDRPWKGTASGVETAEGAAIRGRASHLGHYTGELAVEFVEPGLFEGPGTLTAANGDEVHVLVVFQFPIVEVDPPIPFTGTITVVGGTGRFEGASGSASFTGFQDYPGGPFSFTWRGAISY